MSFLNALAFDWEELFKRCHRLEEMYRHYQKLDYSDEAYKKAETELFSALFRVANLSQGMFDEAI